MDRFAVTPAVTLKVHQPRSIIAELHGWPARRWITALLSALATVLVIGVPTDLIDTPVFRRDVPPTVWSWPVLIVTGVLTGMLVATYVARKDTAEAKKSESPLGSVGAFLAFFAVGCPVCNKLVLLALGYAGALQWFAPVQPYLAALSLALLAYALWQRISKERTCPSA